MPDMLVLKRDRGSGKLNMMVEIDPSPAPAWTPAPMPEPRSSAEMYRPEPDEDDMDWLLDAVEQYVDDVDMVPLEVTNVNWRDLRRDLQDYARARS